MFLCVLLTRVYNLFALEQFRTISYFSKVIGHKNMQITVSILPLNRGSQSMLRREIPQGKTSHFIKSEK